jgi:chromodomain-helicase-DNA-binding protein 4
MTGKRKTRSGYPATKRMKAAFDSDCDDMMDDDLPSRVASTRSRSIMSGSDDNEDVGQTRGRQLRSRASAVVTGNSRSRFVKDDDIDELQQDPPADNDDESDGDFFAIVTSDIQPTRGRPRKGTKRKLMRRKPAVNYSTAQLPESDIEFENSPRAKGNRRSDRANKVMKNMRDPAGGDDNDDIFYVDEAPVAAPRVANVRETFQSCDNIEFKAAHRPVCNTCGGKEQKGMFIYCQGCCNSFHRLCIGSRSDRKQRVTKVGPENFVLQCQFCVGKPKAGREARAPKRPQQDVCQGCHCKGASSAPFSEKRTPKVEERLRLENDGEDPIQEVATKLLNNPGNVLFRCSKCRRAWHYEHLPHPIESPDPAHKDPQSIAKHRLQEYSITWLCKECQNVEDVKIDKLVAWRPMDRSKKGRRDIQLEDLNEDELEYLIKWVGKSYGHCDWMPGAWLYEYAPSTMRLAFFKRHFDLEDLAAEGEDGQRGSLLKFDKKEAIPDSQLTPEVILDVHWTARSASHEARYKRMSLEDKLDDDMKTRIYHVQQIYVKYEGLGYNDAVWETPPDPKSLYYAAFLLAYKEFLVGRHFQCVNSSEIKKNVEAFRKQRDYFIENEAKLKGQPEGLVGGKLMQYQLDGRDWILHNYQNEKSVILADEMGLGKTIQVVAFLRHVVLEAPKAWPFLVVVPNATCPNWRREIKKWAPELRVVLYFGGAQAQELAYKYELFPNNTNYMTAHIVVMSYQSAVDVSTKARFSSVKWAGLVVDEAHALKNDQTNLVRALRAMHIPFSLLLTGTPLQNNKKELFTLLSFVDRKIDPASLDEKYTDDNLTQEVIGELHDLIRPYFLRRTKATVLKFLPPMAQIIVPLSMSVLQERLCKSILEKNPQLIRAIFANSRMKANEKTGMNNILLQLRKCLCHPFIYSRALEDRNVDPQVGYRNLIEASSKLLLLEHMLPKLRDRGHRALIFTQFLGQLDILEDFLVGIGIRYQRIDGEVSSLEKQKRIDQFNAPNSTLSVMLLSTRAGGVGINLATADTVIILDPDWNPHQDIQALSRAHRIGQQKKVLCFQLTTQDSAEERIMQIGRKKMALDHVLIETMDSKDSDGTDKDIESALRFGAAALFGEGKRKDRIIYDSAAVDKLLDRAEQEETNTEGNEVATESVFSKARVWANDDDDLKDNIEGAEQALKLSVWDDIIKQREAEARKEEEKNRQVLGRGGRRRQVCAPTLEAACLTVLEQIEKHEANMGKHSLTTRATWSRTAILWKPAATGHPTPTSLAATQMQSRRMERRMIVRAASRQQRD